MPRSPRSCSGLTRAFSVGVYHPQRVNVSWRGRALLDVTVVRGPPWAMACNDTQNSRGVAFQGGERGGEMSERPPKEAVTKQGETLLSSSPGAAAPSAPQRRWSVVVPPSTSRAISRGPAVRRRFLLRFKRGKHGGTERASDLPGVTQRSEAALQLISLCSTVTRRQGDRSLPDSSRRPAWGPVEQKMRLSLNSPLVLFCTLLGGHRGLVCVFQKDVWKSEPPVPMSGILLENRVFAGVIELR